MIAWILGAPSDDWEQLFRWTNEVIGKDDPEYRRPGETPGQTIKRARGEVHVYFRELIGQRRRDPQDDLMSELIRGEVNGAPLSDEQLVSYCELLVEAGNETTRNAITGGLLAFTEHPGEWDKLRAAPDLMDDAVEEILRWVTPISHFTRTATEDSEVRGTRIAAGEQVALYFASANRDEEVFDDPFAFRVDRRPEPPPRVRVRRALLHGGVRRAGRARDDLPAPARASGVVRGRRSGRTSELDRQRQHQAPAARVPGLVTSEEVSRASC